MERQYGFIDISGRWLIEPKFANLLPKMQKFDLRIAFGSLCYGIYALLVEYLKEHKVFRSMDDILSAELSSRNIGTHGEFREHAKCDL